MDKASLQRLFKRPTSAHKYNFGHVLVIGGAEGMVGAPLLCAKAALRVGAGLTTIAAPNYAASKLDRRVEEMMTLHLPDSPSQATAALLDFIDKRQVNALAVGPGLNETFGQTVRHFLAKIKQPIVLDAAGLSAFSDHKDELTAIAKRTPVIITPHSGEYQSFTGQDLPGSEAEIDKTVSAQAKKLNVTIVLKGHRTLVAHPDGSTYRNTTGNPGMATAGSGDVLAGVIAGVMAQKIAPYQAAELGVYLHGLAGDAARHKNTAPGMIAGDIIENLPGALKQLAQENGIAP